MGKLPVFKSRDTSQRSRAARRATSPSAKNSRNGHNDSPSSTKSTFSSNAGVSKRKKKSELTRNQKLRAQKAMEKADAIADQMEIRVKRSEGKSKVIQSRSKEWTDVNSKAEPKKSLGFNLLKDEDEDEENPKDEIKPALPIRFGNETEVLLDAETQEDPLTLPLRSLDTPTVAVPDPPQLPK